MLREVKSVVIMGSKEAMSKIKANKPKYDFKMTFSGFDKDKAEIESVNNNGKKTLSLIIHDSYSMKVEY